jgi:hypothetical protein
MHPVGSPRWNKTHNEACTSGGANCQVCHRTVLSRISSDHMLPSKDERDELTPQPM